MNYATPIPGMAPLPQRRAEDTMLRLPATGQGIVWLTDFIPHPGLVGLKVTKGEDLIIDDVGGSLVIMERDHRPRTGDVCGTRPHGLVRLGVRIYSDEALVPGTYVFWLQGIDFDCNRLVFIPRSPFSIDQRTTPVTRITVTIVSPSPTPPVNMPIFWKDITGLSGGGSTNLDGIPTVALPFGTTVTLIIRNQDGSDTIQDWHLYEMVDGDIDDPTHGVVLPDDNNPATNPRVWKRLR